MPLFYVITFYGVIFGILGLFTHSFKTLILKGKILPQAVLLQPILFCLLYFLIYIMFGDGYYKYDTPPIWLDWIQFTIAHILRATDVLDVIEEFKINIQNVKHASNVVATIVLVMHWMMDIFILGVLWRISFRYSKSSYFEIFNNKRLIISVGISIWLAFALTLGLQASEQHHNITWILWNLLIFWPLDNVIRVIDVGDSFQLYGIRLHQANLNIWTAFLAVAFRSLLSIPIAQFINWCHMRCFSGIGKTITAFIEELANPETTDHATAGLLALGSNAIPELIIALTNPHPDIRSSATDILYRMHTETQIAVKSMDRTTRATVITALRDALMDLQWSAQKIAAHILGLIGPAAKPALPQLVQALGYSDPEVHSTIDSTLLSIDNNWWLKKETASAIVNLAKSLLIRNAVDKKVDPEVMKRITPEIIATTANIKTKITKLGVVFPSKDAEYLWNAVKVTLANRNGNERDDTLRAIKKIETTPIAIITMLVQILTDLTTRTKQQEARAQIRMEAVKMQAQEIKRQAEERRQAEAQKTTKLKGKMYTNKTGISLKMWRRVNAIALLVLLSIIPLWIIWLQYKKSTRVYYTPIYVVNEDGTALDTANNLMWKRCAEGQTWSKYTCKGETAMLPLPSLSLLATFAEYSDWRLPTTDEIVLLKEINKKVFPNSRYTFFWANNDTLPKRITLIMVPGTVRDVPHPEYLWAMRLVRDLK